MERHGSERKMAHDVLPFIRLGRGGYELEIQNVPPNRGANLVAKKQARKRSPLTLPILGQRPEANILRVGPIPKFEPFSIMSTEPPSELRGGRSIAAHHRTPLGTLQKTRSPIGPRIGCGKAGHGRAGQAFALVESGVVDGATANSSPRTAAGHKQGDQAAKTKPPAGSCSRILDQSLGPMGARSSKHWPLE
jgi:hypothetical protein